jgi:fibronectin-binding autotransporter adhesin
MLTRIPRFVNRRSRQRGAVALTADQSWTSASGRTITAAGALTGTFNLTKTGAGSLILEGPVSNNAGNFIINTASGAAASSTVFPGKTGGAVAVGANKSVQFGTGTIEQMNLRMLQPNQFGSGVVMNFGNATGNWGRFDLNGTNQTLADINAGALTTQGGAIIPNRLVSDNTSQLGPNTFLVRYADSNAVTLEATNVVASPYDTRASAKGLIGANDDPALDPDKDAIQPSVLAWNEH